MRGGIGELLEMFRVVSLDSISSFSYTPAIIFFLLILFKCKKLTRVVFRLFLFHKKLLDFFEVYFYLYIFMYF